MHGYAWAATNADGQDDWPRLIQAFAVASLITAMPILLHLVSQPVALLSCAAAAILATIYMEQDIPIIVLVPNIFQNIFAALISSYVDEYAEIEVMKSYSFVTTVVCWLVVAIGFARKPSAFSPFVRQLILASVGLLAIIGLYFLAGLALNPRNATVYLRNIGLPILLFQMFLVIGSKHRVPLPKILTLILGAVATCGYLELFALDFWLTITNGWRYLTLFSAKRLVNVSDINTAAAQGFVVTSVLDYSKSTLFNTTLFSDLKITVQRLQGPNFNTISFAYLLSILITLLALHKRWLLALFATPLLIATSAKGPLVLMLASVVFYMTAQRTKSDFPVKGLTLFLCVYAVVVFQLGYSSGDYHVLGLLGGLNGFMKWPIGHTLGDGGNLSIVDFSTLDWGNFQRSGSADVAVESAFGVLLYQLGVAAAAWFLFYLWVASIGWRLFKETGAPALSFVVSAILVCMFNGLFQEDAYFVPFSLAFVMGFCGLALGAADRAVVEKLVWAHENRTLFSSRSERRYLKLQEERG